MSTTFPEVTYRLLADGRTEFLSSGAAGPNEGPNVLSTEFRLKPCRDIGVRRAEISGGTKTMTLEIVNINPGDLQVVLNFKTVDGTAAELGLACTVAGTCRLVEL